MKTKKQQLLIHGKIETTQPTTLEQLWGGKGLNKYNTMDNLEYEKQLDEMNKSDLQAHSVNIAGVIPVDDREILKKRLMKEFNLHVASYNVPKYSPTKPNMKKLEKAARIVAEGR
jgi:hypothetical protein